MLNWNGRDDTLVCLGTVDRLDYAWLEVLLVDNGSSDGLASLVRRRKWQHPVQVIENGRNLGYAGGNNVGLRLALNGGADFVMLLNNDTEVAPDLVSKLVAGATAAPGSAVVGPRIFYRSRSDVLWFAGAEWDSKALTFRWPGQGLTEKAAGALASETAYVCGAAMMFRRSALEQIGLLDERFFLVYEESDWCFRARRAGYRCLMVPEARIWHKVGASFGTEQSPLRAYFSTRNELLWGAKNLDRASYRRLRQRIVSRHWPSFSLGASSAGLPAKLRWGARQYARDIRRLWSEPVQAASRRGLYDYFLGRFGDCPDEVREINTRWVEERKKPTSPADAAAGPKGPAL